MQQEEKTVLDRLNALEKIDHERIYKEAVREALKEWLDEKFTTVGKWTVNSFFAVLLAAAVYFVLAYNGWKHSP
jgi:hypothetical protein